MPSTYGRPWIDAHAPSSFRTNANAVAAREISGCPRSPSADYIAFAEQKTSPVTESSATAAREPPHRRAAPQDFTRLGTNAMSGPGVYEPGEEYVPAGIKPLVDEGSLPVAPAAGGEELWLIQIPHDADPADLDGLRFKISDDDAGAEISQFKAGGKTQGYSTPPPTYKYRPSSYHEPTAEPAFPTTLAFVFTLPSS